MKKRTAVSKANPIIKGQTENIWDRQYDSYLRYTTKISLDSVEVAVGALMEPRYYLALHLADLGLNPGTFLEIGALYVHPDHRKHGLAVELVSSQEILLGELGMNPTCCIMEGNHRSQMLFTKLGYRPRGSFAGVDGLNLVFTR